MQKTVINFIYFLWIVLNLYDYICKNMNNFIWDISLR